MKKILPIAMLVFIFLSGLNETYGYSPTTNTSTKRGQTKTNSSSSKSSSNFSIATILNKKGNALSTIGSSLEKAGFKLIFKKDSKDTFDDGYSYVATIDKQYQKNGIKVDYSYIKSSGEITYINIRFPNNFSKNEFVKTIRPFFQKNNIRIDDWNEGIIHYIAWLSYGQISIEGLSIDFLWI